MPYIREYTALNPQERRQLRFKRKFKEDHPRWDDSMVFLARLVAEYLPTSASVLDFGCGHGNFVIDELRGRFFHRVGFDILSESATGNTSVERVVIGDGEALPFEDASFDAVVSLWVMEHVKHPERIFSEIRRVLKPGGIFAFVTPNRRSLLIALRRLMSKRTADHLLRIFYGRDDDDVFDVYYRANDLLTLHALAKASGLSAEILLENADPSYTSFGSISYGLSRFFSRKDLSWAKPHIIGVIRKEA